MPMIDTATHVCAVIGNPVEHSLSPLLHNAAFQAAQLNYVYVAFRVEDVKGCLDGMRALEGFRGMSVTIPHKVAVIEQLDAIEPMAAHVGAVNTIVNEGGRLLGLTTDGPGTLRAFQHAGVSFERKKVLFVGSGGAVRSVAFAVAGMTSAAQVTILGRTQRNVESLANDLAAKTQASIESGSLAEDLAPHMATHDIVIQGTPVGLYPHGIYGTIIPKELLRPEQVVFDMVYRPLKTRLIREAEEAGCQTIPGLEMLIHQAALQFERWTGAPAPIEVMRNALLTRMAERPDRPGAMAS